MNAPTHQSVHASAGSARPTASDIVVRHIERTCRLVLDGRQAARALAEWTERFALGETEFQVLWRLRGAAADGTDQTTLARHLACSAAQVSATVERLRARGWLNKVSRADDRRRQFWRLAPAGEALLGEMLQAAALLTHNSLHDAFYGTAKKDDGQEAAA